MANYSKVIDIVWLYRIWLNSICEFAYDYFLVLNIWLEV